MIDPITPAQVTAPVMYGIQFMFADTSRAEPICLGKAEWPDDTYRKVQWNRISKVEQIIYTSFQAILLGPDDAPLAVAAVPAEAVEVMLDKPIEFLVNSARENTVLRAADLKLPVKKTLVCNRTRIS